MSNGLPIRQAAHAGSWYTADGRRLSEELNHWLAAAAADNGAPAVNEAAARAIIGPHAGYRYCGANAAYAYKCIDPARFDRVFILGPSHKYRLGGCAVTKCSKYRTPLYDLTVDREITEELLSTGEFETMTLAADEDEHSIEMHLSYVAKAMERKGPNGFKIVPVLVGSLSYEDEVRYGEIFAKYMMDPRNFFVISSDFCHWGQRFRYTHYDEKCGEIHQSIRELDFMGMNLIENLDHEGFSAYLNKFGNTICGRRPIGVFLGIVSALRRRKVGNSDGSGVGLPFSFKFLNYDQSNQVRNMQDSSVSYAAGTFTMG